MNLIIQEKLLRTSRQTRHALSVTARESKQRNVMFRDPPHNSSHFHLLVPENGNITDVSNKLKLPEPESSVRNELIWLRESSHFSWQLNAHEIGRRCFRSGLLAVLPPTPDHVRGNLPSISFIYEAAPDGQTQSITFTALELYWIRDRFETHQLTLLTLERLKCSRQHLTLVIIHEEEDVVLNFSFILICFFSLLISMPNFHVYPRFGHCFSSTVRSYRYFFIHGWQLKLAGYSKINIIQYVSHSTNIL